MSLPQQNNNKTQRLSKLHQKTGRRDNLPVLVHKLKAKHASEKH